MKYGIKQNNGKIKAISRFANDKIPAGFEEISHAEYEEFLIAVEANPFSNFNPKSKKIKGDNQALVNLKKKLAKTEVRQKLRQLSIELDLKARLNEDSTSTQAEFDELKAQYDGM